LGWGVLIEADHSVDAGESAEDSRECLAIDVTGSIRSGRLIEVLTRLVSERPSLPI
jgi:hypothetical protein